MAELIWTEPALADLGELAEYIALDNASAAKAFVQAVLSAVERLAQFPESERTPPELPQLGYREVIVPPCRVFYKVAGDSVLLLFVLREERDLRNFMLSLGDN
ncbi:type II toxin-antitoxin system RelE/ParE family toxin [Aestuariirhabdus sp. LZHN29]|uniref:type II toxin-antitoxin system RelE/ParE family toxin n=1 Tax=Aestuariirhabdus sp. LZHN29 TaxID=3417462 RepID=UPI003CF8D94A